MEAGRRETLVSNAVEQLAQSSTAQCNAAQHSSTPPQAAM